MLPSRSGRVERVRLARWLAPVAVMAATAWSSHQPAAVTVASHGDKLVHALVFACLSLLWLLALADTRLSRGARLAWAGGISAGWGILDELHQSFVPARDAEIGDALADIAGAMLVVAVAWSAWRGGSERSPRPAPTSSRRGPR